VGLIFAELRAYEPGDDVRLLDWNVTARQGRPYVRRYVEERALTLWLIVDVSASLRFGPEGKSKADRAAQAAALLATAAVQNSDRVGLILVSDRIEAELPPRGGPRHLARLIRLLVAPTATARRTDLAVALSRLPGRGRRGLVVVLSDFEGVEQASLWRQVARRHEVLAIRLVEPREEALPAAGIVALEDAELGSRLVVDMGSSRLRTAYAEAALQRLAAFRKWTALAGVSTLEISTAQDPIGPLIAHFRDRAAPRGGP
jgi:uncharacterized protein (DUF58 family)